MALAIQEALEGKYEILEKIGEGGIGSVYKVKHRLLEELRVIKVLRPQAAAKEDLQERFVREARMAIRLKHPGIAQLHDFAVTADGTAYIVMEFIDGVGLDALLQATGPPSVDLALEASRQALTALGYLHAHRFVHRDVSPDNLMLTRDFDGKPLVKLIDLGIAKNLEGGMQLTATGVFVGKVRYSSPEQFSAQGGGDEIDQRSDIYSFGVLLYELLTGEMPVSGDSFSEVAGGHLFHPPRPFAETDPEGRLQDGLRQAVFKALEKEPDKRYASTEEMIAALEPFADPAADLSPEMESRISRTRDALPAVDGTKKPGSTQNRLDAEFGLATTPTPALLTEAAGDVTAATPTEDLKLVAGNIDNLIRAGKLKQADRALTRALGVFGDIRPLADLRDRLAAARRRAPAAALRGLFGAIGDRWISWAAGALILAAAAGGTWLALGGRGAPESAPTVGGVAKFQLPAAPEPWRPEDAAVVVADAAGSDPLLVADADVPEPPPLDDESPPAPQATAQTAPAPRSDPRAVDPDTTPSPDGTAPEPSAGDQVAEPPPPRPDDPDPADPSRGTPGPRGRTTDIYPPGAVGVTPPVLISMPAAVFPLERPPKKDVVYVVTLLVDEFGNPLNPSIKRGPAFRKRVRDTAIEVATGARFRPATRNGIAGRMWTDVQVVFPGTDP